MIRDFLHLVFPRLCPACGDALHRTEKVVCLQCRLELPHTGYHRHVDNPISRLFWGRIPVRCATAFYFFRKQGKVQELLHHLKYENQPEIGEEIGRWYGRELHTSEYGQSDFIIPVPLHPHKLARRGYNQSEAFARGLEATLGLPARNDLLLRSTNSESQTRKGRYARWRNVETVFTTGNTNEIRNRQILLVDDVITTGATLESCARELFQAGAAQVRIASIAAPVF